MKARLLPRRVSDRDLVRNTVRSHEISRYCRLMAGCVAQKSRIPQGMFQQFQHCGSLSPPSAAESPCCAQGEGATEAEITYQVRMM